MTLLDYPQVPLTLSSVQTAGGETLCVTGYLDAFTVPLLRPALLAAAERCPHPKAGALTLDLSCVRFIDRAGLDLLRSVRDTADAQRALIVRLRPGSQPETIFGASALAGLLTASH